MDEAAGLLRIDQQEDPHRAHCHKSHIIDYGHVSRQHPHLNTVFVDMSDMIPQNMV